MQQQEGVALSLEQLAAMEVDDCYKRLFCVAATGRVTESSLTSLLQLVESGAEATTTLTAPLSKQAERIRDSARYGDSR